jgi:hypothetical protein
MASMNKETETYYNKYFDLFTTDGYKQLIEELKSNAVAINNVDAIKDEKDMYFRKGQLNVLALLINFETTIDNAFKEITADVESF